MFHKNHVTVGMVFFFLLIVLSGCVHRPYVTASYSRWGNEMVLEQGGEEPLILRTLPSQSNQASACVLLVHGMNEHIGRYGEVARYFSQRYFVAGFDHYAHGLSNPVLRRADRALAEGADRADVSDAFLAQSALYDLEPLRQTLGLALQAFMAQCDAQDHSRRPVFIVAHSLGGLVTASYLLRHQNESDLRERLRGVVFLAPAFAVSEPPGWRGWVANPLIKLSFYAETHFLHPQNEPLPLLLFNQLLSLVTVPVLDGLFEAFSWPGLRNFASPTSPVWVTDYLTDSEEEKARLRADGWIVRRSLLRYVKGIEAEVVHFRRHMADFSIPYYLIYSEMDPITPAWGDEDFARVTLQHNPANEVLKLPGLPYHQHIFMQEPARTELLQKIEKWLDRRLQMPN
ncbi:Lysophospholipase, alpha-beta hydrolase superfamily [Nitrosomonas oligotropha]|uniref:Lysophospholipase, alpha-beta hydrolase superfamily n=2 Tax=Nitrosomonas oligotropha TaxID=42354 RepID=A0A1H8Q7P1_9PROT|nr:Lysophospholipase, alpha-beta hydrolase superfamily [Nitrosomonas oligotropha]SEO49773.1 Lysophospholipase, alpha-beta hydrolase superfamily [Nitrosomonas oligotropha]